MCNVNSSQGGVSEMDDQLILNAIKQANRWGAKGIEVIGFVWPLTAASDYHLTLIAQIPRDRTAADKAWYDE